MTTLSIKISKFLSYVLRHKPDAIGIAMDNNGWVSINELIDKANQHGTQLTQENIEEVVDTNDKQRFALSEDKQFIRANQGHSLNVDLELKPIKPPDILYHGTATRFLESIRKEGLKAGNRQFVHLSKDVKTATEVGMRYGKPMILNIDAKCMHQQGYQFFLAENGVWLANKVPIDFIILA